MQEAGDLVHQSCKVVFDAIIPVYEERQTTPYMIFISTGTHSHPPPPPNIPPERLVQELKDIISRLKNPDLTLGINPL
jgi:hypothetical protein